MNSLIVLNNVKKEYQMGHTTVQALRGVNLSLQKGKYYSIVGPSGSGKSTLLHILGCMDVPSSGEVQINGRQIGGLSERELTSVRARDIGFVFQAFHLNPILTVHENVAIALQFLGVRKNEANRRAAEWLERVGLGPRLGHYPSELSGGERQRVAIARAIVKNPALILADEPTGNLDSKTGCEIVELLREINCQSGTTIIQVTHDREIAGMSDEIVSLRDGIVVS
jgi:putative ABC transport system ATP-binding protein